MRRREHERQAHWEAVLQRIHVVPVTDVFQAITWLEQHHRQWTAPRDGDDATAAPRLVVVDSAAALLAPLLAVTGSFRGNACGQ